MSGKWFGKKRVDAEDLAEMLGDALDKAFERHLPSPQDVADSIAKAIDAASFSTAEHLGKITASFHETQQALTGEWKGMIAELKATRDSMAEFPGAVQKVLADFPGDVQKSIADFPGAVSGILETNNTQLARMFQEMTRAVTSQVVEIGRTTEKLAGQLEQVNSLATQIDQVLQIQKTVEGTVRQAVATEEMREVFKSIQEHLAETGSYLQEAAKPRTICLVEADPAELAQEQAASQPVEPPPAKPDMRPIQLEPAPREEESPAPQDETGATVPEETAEAKPEGLSSRLLKPDIEL